MSKHKIGSLGYYLVLSHGELGVFGAGLANHLHSLRPGGQGLNCDRDECVDASDVCGYRLPRRCEESVKQTLYEIVYEVLDRSRIYCDTVDFDFTRKKIIHHISYHWLIYTSKTYTQKANTIKVRTPYCILGAENSQ